MRADPKSAGISTYGTPLISKLGIAPGARVALLGAPEGFDDTLGELPDGVAVARRLGGRKDVVVVFVRARRELERRLEDCDKPITVAVMGCVVNGPIAERRVRKASLDDRLSTEDVIRDVCLPMGLVDVKVCAIDATWSGLKVVIRKELR